MIKILVRNRLRSFFGSLVGRSRGGDVKKASRAKIVGIIILYTYVIMTFLFLSAALSVFLGKTLIPLGISWLYFAIFMLAVLSITFVFGIFETKSELFECKDNELLLSMPIKPRDIVASRVTVVMVYNYICELIIMLPCIIVYAIYSLDIVGVLGAVIVSVLLPLISTSLSSAVGYIIALISKKIRKNSFVIVAVSIVFLLAYMFGYQALVNNMTAFLEEVQSSGGVLVSDMPWLYHIGQTALLKPVNITFLAVLSLYVGALTYYLISRSYIKIVTGNYREKKIEYKGSYIRKKSALNALLRKEFKRFFSSATYMLNSGIGLIFEIILSVVLIIKRKTFIETFSLLLQSFGIADDAIAPVLIMALVFISSFNMMSASALSLEGKQFWILKSSPISAKTVLVSKFLPQIIINLPTTLICSVLFIIASSASAEYWFFFILTPLAAGAFSALFGLVINVAFPKFDYDNEVEVIKQSLATFIVMMGQMIFSVILLVGSFMLSMIMSPFLVSAIAFGVFLILLVSMYFVLMGPCARRYESLEA